MARPKKVEIEGSTVEDAINKAIALLKVPRESLDVKIMCEEKRGLFGMEGAKPAKIKVTIKEKTLDQGAQKRENKKES